MRKWMKKLVTVFLACVISLGTVACKKGNSKEGKLGYEVDQSRLFGMCVLPDFGYSTSVDPGITSEIVCDLLKEMQVKSVRVWMHIPYVLKRAETSNELSFKKAAVEVFHKYFADLKSAGVENILVMSHQYIFPIEIMRPTHSGVIPEPGTDEYMIFMQLFEECYSMLAEEFPEITLWEPNNETDHPKGTTIVRQGYSSSLSESENAQYQYTPEEVAMITMDQCYYANRGIKKHNPKNELVMPGLVFSSTAASAIFIELMYEQIKSGKLPTSYDLDGKRVLPVDTDPDNYFNVLNWHPYANVKPNDDWLQANKDMYNVAVRNGDKGKKLFLSEFGWYDEFKESKQEEIAAWYPEAFDLLKANLPSLEAAFCFRMFNWTAAGSGVKPMEKTFGLFTSPVEDMGITPKPAAIALMKYFNGEDADTSGLYKYKKQQSNGGNR